MDFYTIILYGWLIETIIIIIVLWSIMPKKTKYYCQYCHKKMRKSKLFQEGDIVTQKLWCKKCKRIFEIRQQIIPEELK